MTSKTLMRLILIAALLTSTSVTDVRAADVATDLPGTSWVGPTVTSTVGGDVYDRVWKLDVTVGKVAIIQAAGGAGAELGLYLFGEQVSSIYSDLPVKSSALPGSKQTIVASLSPGVYYVNVNGRNTDRTYSFTLTISLYSDPTPPELFPRVEGGQSRVSGDFVTILSGASDGLSGVSGLRYRYSSAEWSEWSGTVDRATLPLPQSEGAYTIEIQAKNGLGLISQIQPVAITVDRTAPTATLLGSISNESVTSPLPIFTYAFSEVMLKKTLGSSIALNDFRGQSLGGVTKVSPDGTKATFTPSEPLTLGQQYAINIVGATDLAGNIVSSSGGQFFAYRKKTAIQASVTSYSVMYGQVLALRGVTDAIGENSPLQIELRKNGSGEWIKVGTAVARNGTFVGQFNAVSGGEYRVTYAGDQIRAASSSRRIRVSVLTSLQLDGAGPKIRERRAGTTITFAGRVTPMWAEVELQQFRCNSTFTSCRLVERLPVTVLPTGAVSLEWTSTTGYWKFRLSSPSLNELSGSRTKFYLLRVK